MTTGAFRKKEPTSVGRIERASSREPSPSVTPNYTYRRDSYSDGSRRGSFSESSGYNSARTTTGTQTGYSRNSSSITDRGIRAPTPTRRTREPTPTRVQETTRRQYLEDSILHGDRTRREGSYPRLTSGSTSYSSSLTTTPEYGIRAPTPTRLTRDPTPTRLTRDPTPTRYTRDPTPTRLTRDPTPTRLTRDPTPTRYTRDPTPTRLTRDPTPTRRTREPTPTRAQETNLRPYLEEATLRSDCTRREDSCPRFPTDSSDSIKRRSTASTYDNDRSSSSRRNSLQFYYDPGKYTAPTTDRDMTGVRSVYTRSLSKDSEITSSGRRAPSSSTYRPLVYTPGSPSPLRRSWGGSSDYQSNKSTSSPSSGKSFAFPDFQSYKSRQTDNTTKSYQDSGLGGYKPRTFSLFGDTFNTDKSRGRRPYSADFYSTPSKLYDNLSSSKTSDHRLSYDETRSTQSASTNIQREPTIVSKTTTDKTSDYKRPHFFQRLMGYTEASEPKVKPKSEQNLDKSYQSGLESDKPKYQSDQSPDKSYKSALEAEPKSKTSLLKSESLQSNTSQGSLDDLQGSYQSPKPKLVRSASSDYYDNLDYRETRGLRSASPSSNITKTRKLNKSGSLDRPHIKLRTRFKDEVSVLYYDQKEKATAVGQEEAVREQQKLKDDRTASATVTESAVRLPCTVHLGQACGQPHLPRIMEQSEASVIGNIDVDGDINRKPIFANKSHEIVQHEDGDFEIKLIVQIAANFLRNKTSVKATSGGKRLIVIGYRDEGEGDSAHVHQYIEKMTLPHLIDAYSVRATMDREGNLKISAPMSIPVEQKPEVETSPNPGEDAT